MATVNRKAISSPHVVAPLAPYSQGLQVGNTLYISGQLGLTLEVELLEGIEAQTRQALTNIGHILQAAGANFDDVVKVTVLLADFNHFGQVNTVYSEFFTNVLPARAAFQVARLPRDALVEIEAVAVLPEAAEETA